MALVQTSTAAKALPPEIVALRARYEVAQKRLVEMIMGAEAKGNVTDYRKRILAGVRDELKKLDEFAAKWTAQQIPDAYDEGAMARISLELGSRGTARYETLSAIPVDDFIASL